MSPGSGPRATVVGAGPMGSALARALLAGGVAVTVFNRTRARAEPLAAAGAVLADSLPEAIAGSHLTLMCVAHQAAARELLDDEEVWHALDGRTLVQLTTGTADDGRRTAEQAGAHDVACLVGAILAYPRSMGTEDAVVFYGGHEGVFDAHRQVLERLGQARYVGTDAGSAAVIDAAMISLFYGTIAGLLHGGRLAEAVGMTRERFAEIAQPFFSGFVSDAVAETLERIVARRYGEAQSSMDTHLGGIDFLVVGVSRELGVDHAVPAAIRDWYARAVEAGRGADDLAVLIDVPSG
jgi:3-hydroxyisobutyrate dehydrogenase-like beta-hydroxyacid dehydrogenase